MIIADCRGLELTAASPEAVAYLDRAVEAHLGLRHDTGDLLAAALAEDETLLLGHVFRGCFTLYYANRRFVERAQASLAAAEAIAETHGATERERVHMSALAAWCRGDVRAATGLWERILIDHPCDVVALRLAHYWHFYFGDSTEIRNSVARVLHAWDDSVPDYGFVRGMYAFGLEESGDYNAAEREGRAAVECNPADIWATHAVSHVMEIQGRAREGIDWIGDHSENWSNVANFAFHVYWHQALHCFELGAFERALEIYDRDVRPGSVVEYLDISNSAALLWRLEQEGVDVGDRWAELVGLSAERADDQMLVFADAHYMMAFAGAGDVRLGEVLLEKMKAYAETSDEYEAEIAAEVGVPLMEALTAHRNGKSHRAVELLMSIRPRLGAIGGSHAQRDVFETTLIDAAIAAEKLTLARALLSERLHRRPRSGLSWRRYACVLHDLGDGDGAARATAAADLLLEPS